MEKSVAMARVRDPIQFEKHYLEGRAVIEKMLFDPAFQLLHAFGYTSFDYTRGKDITVQAEIDSSSVTAIMDLLQLDRDNQPTSIEGMYS